MNERIEQCLYLSGLTAQGCWDELDDYAKQGIHKFAELIVRECLLKIEDERYELPDFIVDSVKQHFGVKE